MISSFSAHPKAQNKRSRNLMIVFFVIAGIAVIVSSIMPTYSWIAGLVALGSITTAILLYTKYVSVDFYYDIIAEEGEEALLVVRQQVGKRSVTLCRVPLADIISVKKETREERRNHKRESGVGLYVYSPTMSPNVSFRIFVSNRYERSEVVMEGSDEFFGKIKEFSIEARKNRAFDDEE